MRAGAGRVVVIGSSCAGKTTLAQELARAWGCDLIELDDLERLKKEDRL